MDRITLQKELDATKKRMNEIEALIRKLEYEKIEILEMRVSIFKQIKDNGFVVEDGIVKELEK
jgi:division protein CdvB (Snf7/Vps24/ESCRT-III family)